MWIRNPLEKADDKVASDSDGDGIMDADDSCPTVKGIAKFDGCPDRDGDGIPDKDDNCPDEKGVASEKGCPEVKAALEELQRLFKNLQFDVNKTTIRPVSYQDLNTAADILQDYPEYNVVIEGHTDSDGGDQYNKTLSQGRADAAKQYLIDKGVTGGRVTAIGYGEERPIAPNDTPKNKQKNRRVIIKLIKR